MSTVFSDALGNKFLGDCKWGNHDINYPSTNWLKGVGKLTPSTTFLSDISSVLSSSSYTSISVYGAQLNNNIPTNSTIFSARAPGRANAFRLRSGAYSNKYPQGDIGNTIIMDTSTTSSFNYNSDASESAFDYAFCVGPNSVALMAWKYNTGYTAFFNNWCPVFYYWGFLGNVNTNFGYYNASEINSAVFLSYGTNGSIGFTSYASYTVVNLHYIAGAQKTLLTTGDAMYPIACQGGSPTPTGQWATDLYFFDNNATLGYPAIGKAENLLLGVGTFTYLKPVTLITPPDAGSNLWLPVGTFAGRTLLMRIYAE